MKTRTRKVATVGAALMLTVSLAACSSDDNASSTESDSESAVSGLTYPIVDTNQGLCYDNFDQIDCPTEGEAFYGQDAQYTGNTPSYTDNGEGTVVDNVTGLVWTQDISTSSMPWSESAAYCEALDTGDITDWRVPSVDELWSLRDFSQGWPWVDTDYFSLVGDGSDLAQHHSWSSNEYLVESEYQNDQVADSPAWIVNDWTGHIKAMSGSRFVRCVSGDEYGVNDFVDNTDGTVSDNATGLMWTQSDNGEALNWEDALDYAANATVSGYDDWRLPSIKELQSLADYSGIFPVIDDGFFDLTELTNVVTDADTGEQIDTQVDYPFYWSSTSNPYIEAFHDESGDAEVATEDLGYTYAWMLSSGYTTDMNGYDLHGAGAVVFDTKSEDVTDGSGIEIFYHYVMLVRDGGVTETTTGDPTTVNPDRVVVFDEGETSQGGQGGGGEAPDFASVAAVLGVTEDELLAAIGEPGTDLDTTAAAAELGVTVEEFEAAFSSIGGTPPGDGEAPADPSQDTP